VRALVVAILLVALPSMAAAEGSGQVCPAQTPPPFVLLPQLPDVACVRETEHGDVRCTAPTTPGIGSTFVNLGAPDTGVALAGHTVCAGGSRDQALEGDINTPGATVDAEWVSSRYGSPQAKTSRITVDAAGQGIFLHAEWHGTERAGEPSTCTMTITALNSVRPASYHDPRCAARPPDSPAIAWGTVLRPRSPLLP
jgi:hypothetical protein